MNFVIEKEFLKIKYADVVKYTAVCGCYEPDLFIDDHTSRVIGEGKTQEEARTEAWKKCAIGTDIIGSGEKLKVKCEYIPSYSTTGQN